MVLSYRKQVYRTFSKGLLKAGNAARKLTGGPGTAAQKHANLLMRTLPASVVVDRIGKLSSRGGLSFNTPTTGRTKQVNLRRRPFMNTAYFAGKRFSYRRPGKVAKKRYKKAFNGVQWCIERADTVLDTKCVFAEHCSVPIKTVAKFTVYAMVKKLLNEADIQFSDWNELRAGRIVDGDSIALTYKKFFSSTSGTVISITVATGDTTYGSVAEKFWLAIFNGLINPSGGVDGMLPQAQLSTLSFVVGGGHKAELNLRGASMSCIVKSSLKMQNRSYNIATDNESDDINNVPLYGKTYEGRGNGFLPRDNSNVMAPCDVDYAWNIYGASSSTTLQEPPEAYQLQYVTRSGKATIPPGKIKTSVINDRIVMSLDTFFKTCYSQYPGTASDNLQFHRMGKIRMFAFERPIATLPGEVTPGVAMAVEHDYKGWVQINVKKGQYTAPVNIVI